MINNKILLILVFVALLSVGVFSAQFVNKTQLIDYAGKAILSLDENTTLGASVDYETFITVQTKGQEYSLARLIEGSISDRSFDNSIVFEMPNGELSTGRFNSTITNFKLKNDTETIATIIDPGVSIIKLKDGKFIPVKIIKGTVHEGRLTGDFSAILFDSGYQLNGTIATRKIASGFIKPETTYINPTSRILAQIALYETKLRYEPLSYVGQTVLGVSTEAKITAENSANSAGALSIDGTAVVPQYSLGTYQVGEKAIASISSADVKKIVLDSLTSSLSLIENKSIELGVDSVTGREIKNDSVNNADLANDAVNSEKIENNTVTGTDINDDSIESTDVKDNTLTASDLSDGLVFGSGDFIDLSAVSHSSSAKQGLLLPNTSGSPVAPVSGEGYIAYDTTNNQLIVYDGGSWGTISGTGDITAVVAGNGLSGGATSGSASLAVALTTSGTTGSTSSNSGLEVGSGGLTLLKGCSDNEVLKYTDAGGWACATDASGSGSATIQEGDVSVVATASTFDFLGADFTITESPSGEANISIDYANSGILTASNYTSTLDSVYVNVGESPAAGDISGSFTGGLTIGANTVALATDTTGNYVATITGDSQVSVSGSGTENAAVSLSIAADSIGDTQLAFNTGQNLTSTSTPTFAGLTLNGSLTLANSETVSNGTDGTFTLGRNDAGTVTLTAADNDTTAAFTILPGGAAALTLGGASTTAVTVTTDGTGDGEVVLPGNSIGNAELVNSGITFAGNTGSGSVALGGTLTVTGAGINNAVYSGGTITVTGTEADTLNTVAGRGASTATALTLSSTSNAITAGTLTINSDAFTDLTGTGLTISAGALQATLGTSIANSELDNDTVDFDKVSDTLTLDAATSITAGSALGLTIGNNVTLSATGTGAITATDLSCTDCIGATEITDLTLGTDTAGNYVATVTGGAGLTGSGSSEGSTPTLAVGAGNGITVNADDIAVNLTTTGTTGSTSSNSGLEVGSGGLSLLKGCADNEILKWTDAGGWACATDTSGSGSSAVQEGDSTVVASLSTLDFLGADFIVSESPAGEANVSIDYANSGITRVGQAETVTGGWTFNTAATTFTTAIDVNTASTIAGLTVDGNANFSVSNGSIDGALSLSGTTADNASQITLTNGTTSGTQNIAYLDNAASTGTTESVLVIDNSDTDTAVTNGIEFVDAGGGFTNLFNVAGTLISSAEFTRLDGKDAALVDTNDAVATAITGTGTLTAGATGAGFTLNFGTSTLSGNVTGANISGVDISDDTNLTATDGITLTGDQLTLSSTTGGAGLTYTTGVLAVGAGTGISVAADSISATLGTDITNSELVNDTIDFDKVSDTLTLDAATSITAGSALGLTIGNNVTLSATGTGAITATDLSCTDCIGATEISDLTLGTDTAGNYVATVTGGAGLTGSGSSEGSTPTLAVGAGTGITVNADDVAVNQDTAFAWTNGTTYTFAGTENLGISSDLAGTVNVISITGTPSSSAGTTSGITITQADSANTNGLDSSLVITNSDTDLAVGAAIKLTSAGGGFTSVIDNAGTLISGSELNLLDGRDTALVDTTDAVATAITGTGTLTAGATGAGFTLNFGTSTLSGNVTGANISGVDISDDTNLTATDGITLTGDQLTLSSTTGGAGLTYTTGVLAVGAGTGISVAADSISATLGTDITNSELVNDTIDFDKVSDTLTLDAATSITAGSALGLTIGNNVTLSATGTGAITATDLSCTDCIGATEITDLTLGTDTAGNYVATVTGGAGLTGSGSSEGSTPTLAVGAGNGITVNADDIAVNLTTTGTTGSTSSNSGLEVGSGGLTLLKGCADNELLKWTDAGGWACATDTSGSGAAAIQEGDSTVVASLSTLDFLGADFIVSESPAGEANVSIDYANSGIARVGQAETVTGGWTFNTASTTFTTAIDVNTASTIAGLTVDGNANLGVSNGSIDGALTLSGTTADNALQITLTNGTSSGNQYIAYLDNAASTGTTDSVLVIDNSDTDTAVTNGIEFVDAGGGFTNLFNVAGTLISSTEFTRLDGKDAALVDTNDAVATAITGTGTLTAGATGAGFTLNFGTSTLSGNVTGANISGVDISDDTNLTATDGITLTGDQLTLSSTTGGAGLTYTTGVLAVGAGTGISVAADSISATLGTDIANSEIQADTIDWDSISDTMTLDAATTITRTSNATNEDSLSIALVNSGGTAGTDRTFVISNAVSTNSTGDVTTEALLVLDQADTTASGTTAVTDGLLITNSGGSTFTNAITVGSGSQAIATALNIASTGVTTDISLQNGETIDNNSDGSINLTTTTLTLTGSTTITASSLATLTTAATLTTSGNLTVQGTTGLTLSGSGADLTFANSESITNDTNGQINFKRNDAGTVTLTAEDNDTTAALTILPGGAAALTLGGSSTTAITLTTDSTGDAEVVLPANSVGNSELVNSGITFAGDSGSSSTALGGTRTIAGGNGLTSAESGGTVTLTVGAGTGISVAADSISATLGTDIANSEIQADTIDWDSISDTMTLDAATTITRTSSTTSEDSLSISLVNSGGTAGTDRAFVIANGVSTNSTGDVTTEALLVLDQADTTTSGTTAVTDGLLISNSGGSTFTNAITVGSGSQAIGTALNIASTGVTTDISLQNGETIDNNSDGVINLTTTTFTLTGATTVTASSLATLTTGATLTVSGNLTVQGTTGLTLSGTGGDLVFANSESITNDTNGQINFKRNDAGTVTLTAEDNDTTAALTILPGGAAALTLGGASTTAITLTTDGTGDAEVVLPTGSISGTEILDDTVTLTTDTNGNYVASATSNGGLVLTGTEGGSLGVLLPAATDALSSTTSSGSGLELVSAGLTLLQGCSDTQVLKWNESSDTWVCSADATGSSTAWDTIGDPSGNGAVAMGATVQTLDWDTAGGTAALDAFTITFQNDITTDASVQRAFVVQNKNDGGATGVTESLIVADNADANEAVTNGLLITSSGAGGITNGINIDDTDVTTDISLQNGETIDNNSDGVINLTTTTLTLTGTTTVTASSLATLTTASTLTVSGNLTVQGTTGLTLSGSGADLTFANSESITNDTDGQINFKRNDAGTVTLTAEDNDTTAALTILPGGAAALTLGGASTTAITLTTDSTGDAEVVLPANSVGNSELVNSGITFAGDTGSSSTALGGTRTIAGGNGLTSAESGGTVTLTVGAGTGISVAADSISATLGTDIANSEIQADTIDWDSISDTMTLDAATTITRTSNATNEDSLSVSLINSGGTAGTDRAFVIANGVSTNSTGDTTTEALLVLDQADTTASGTTAVTDGLLISNSGGSTFTNAITVGSGSQAIATALNIASTGVTTDISLQNGETIDNNSDGSINLTATTLTLTGSTTITASSLATLTTAATLTASGNLTVQGTTGLTLSGSGADLVFANSESITNDTNGQINFKRNDAGTVTLTAEDNDTTAALTILPGGAAALTLGGSSTTAITLTTDSTGDAEVVLPANSVGNSELVNSGITFAGDSGSSSTALGGTRTIAGGNGLTSAESGGTVTLAVGAGTGISVAADSISATLGTDIANSEIQADTIDWDSISDTMTLDAATTITRTSNTTNEDSLSISLVNSGGTAGTDRAFVISNGVSTNAAGDVTTEALLVLDQADTTASGTTAVTDGLLITNSGGSTFTNAITVGSGTQAIATALNIASTGVTTDISLQNGETIDNNSDGVINLTATTLTLTNTTTITASSLATLTTAATLTTSGNLTVQGTTGLTLSGVGGDLTFANSESITNDTNGQINFKRNDAGTVTLTAEDTDTTAALTILPGGAAALTLGGSSTTAITLTTDGTGDAEVVLPDGSISGTEILNDTVTLSTDTNGNYVASATANGGLVLTGTEGGSLGVLLPAATDALSATTSSGSGLELVSAGLTLLQGCADTEVLKWNEASDVWACGTAGGGGTWDTIGDAGGNGAIAFGSTVQTMDWGTMDANASYFTFNFTNAGTSAGTDNGVVINNAVTGSNTDTTTETLLLIQQLDTTVAGTTTVTSGLKIDDASAAPMTDAITINNTGASSAITNAINIADTTGTITTGLLMSGTFTNYIDTPNFDVSNAGVITIAGAQTADITTQSNNALTLTPGGTGQLVLNSANTSASAVDLNATGTVAGAAITLDTTDGGITLTAAGASNGDITLAATDDIGINGTAGSVLSIGTSNVTQTVNIGLATNVDVSITDPNWSVTGAGTGSFADVVCASASCISTGEITANTIDFADISDTPTLDASTAIAFGASTFDFTFTNNGSGNEIHNLSSTGDLVIQDNGNNMVSFADTSVMTFFPANATAANGQVVIDGATTDATLDSATGGVFQLNIDVASTVTAGQGIYLDFQTTDDADATDTYNAMRIDFTNSSVDASDTTTALALNNANDVSGGALDRLISLENNDANTAVGAGIIFLSGGANAPDFTSGINFDAGSFTDEIVLQNGETIRNSSDGLVEMTNNGSATISFFVNTPYIQMGSLVFNNAGVSSFSASDVSIYPDSTGDIILATDTDTFISSDASTSVSFRDFINVQVAGVTSAASGDIWYDSTANKFKINESGTTKTLCNTTDAGCGAGGSGARLDQVTAATAEAGAQDSNNNTVEWNWDFTSAAVDSGLIISESSASTTGTQDQQALFELITLASSTASPMQVTAAGTDVGDIFFNLSGTSDLEVRDNGTAFFILDDTGGMTFTPTAGSDFVFNQAAGSDFQILDSAALTTNAVTIVSDSGTTTDGVDGIDIAFTQGTDTNGADTNAALHVTVTPGAESNNTIDAVSIANVTAGAATERGLVIGTGYDRDIEFADTTPTVRLADASTLVFDDGSASGDLALGRLKEYFSTQNYGIFESGGFINIDGSFFMDNFSAGRLLGTADAATNRYGDGGAWAFDEAGTGGGSTATNSTRYGCNVQQNQLSGIGTYPSQGMLEIAPETSTHTHTNADPGCIVGMSAGTGTNTGGVLRATNKFVAYAKVKVSANFTQAASARQMFWGAHNYTEAWGQGWSSIAATHGFIGFSNLVSTTTATDAQGGTQWNGFSRSGNLISSVTCGTNGNISTATNVYALMRIEARATNDVRFFIDGDTSNGVSLNECGSGISSNIPTQALNPAFNVNQQQNLSGATNQWTMFVDLFAFVQDDPRGGVAPSAPMSEIETAAATPTAPDPIVGADIAENYLFDYGFEKINRGDIAVMTAPGKADVAAREYDRKILGVVSESPGLVLGDGNGNEKALPVALTGRVPVRVSAAGGEIRVGDPITSSAVPGVGMRATKPGKIVGTAMEDFSGSEEGKIMINVNVGYYLGDEGDTALLEQPTPLVLSESTIADVFPQSTESGALAATQSAEPVQNVQAGNQSLVSIISQALRFTSGLEVHGVFNNVGSAIFRGPVEFLAENVFRKSVTFEDTVTFNKDTAGKAVIHEGQRFVDVVFDKEYQNEPIVNASVSVPTVTDSTLVEYIARGTCVAGDSVDSCQDKVAGEILGIDIRFAVVSKSKQGFMILLNAPTPVELTFSWSAMSVKDAKTSTSAGAVSAPMSVPSPTPAVSPEPTAVPVTQVEPEVPTPEPTAVPEESPPAVPQ